MLYKTVLSEVDPYNSQPKISQEAYRTDNFNPLSIQRMRLRSVAALLARRCWSLALGPSGAVRQCNP